MEPQSPKDKEKKGVNITALFENEPKEHNLEVCQDITVFTTHSFSLSPNDPQIHTVVLVTILIW